MARGRSRTRRAVSAAVTVLALVPAGGCVLLDDESAPPPAVDTGAGGGGPESAEPRRDPMLGITTGWGPSAAQIERAVRLVRAMPLRDLAGQVIVADYPGRTAPTALVRDLHLGGVIVFDQNVGASRALRNELRTLRRGVDRPWPLWVSVDQEGGLVERLQDDLTRFPTFMSAGAADRDRVTRAAARGSARELAWLGLTADFAPVADVTAGPGDPTIGSRSASEFAQRASRAVTAAGRGFLDAGVVPVLKHFPGHGSAPADSHVTLPVLDRPLSGLRRIDLAPFRAGIAAGAPAVMVGHLDVRAVDPRTPSSLSRPVVSGLLRDRLGFGGLVVSDALDMAAVTRTAGSSRPAVRALRAGVDMLVMPPSPRLARDGIVAAVRSGALPLRRLQQAAARQGALMLHQRALTREARDTTGPRPPGSARGASWRLSRAAVTQVAGRCGVRHVGDRVLLTGPADDVARLGSAFRTYGVDVVEPPPAAPRRRGPARGDGRPATTPPPPDATRVAVTGYRGGPVSGDVVVATDSPWALGSSTAPVKIAAYGDTTGAMRAVVQVLLGREAPGSLPVRVTGVDRGC
ncbi:glycosyl hyrolase family 3 [Nocardioidaceae bacterium]|nr:glycosyl hyrolase family 3 [Nocardioidaceae bacterium]